MYSRRTIVIEEVEGWPGNGRAAAVGAPGDQLGDRNSSIHALLDMTRTQSILMEATRELHDLTEQIDTYHQNLPPSEDVMMNLPRMLGLLMESRERAKRLYRETLSIKTAEFTCDAQRLFDELQQEILRTDEMLSLYRGRGTYH
ncbi:Gpg1p KNAG_0F02460 [Huiozyma naganishii CBS 8797]|uniref:Uncharacterized protein n=1 Tax=Huiozyma naganishii (strain ATCC MYA-139 / BCRC 22969 / CBS 8797 / KCTC 17520 / NBRC 10181 / NCYC 3082 / Yp74L-3) TaxID=1071383 RepID=J7S8G7_HUIN7|nr:hypothetical protein KNAG_0F02460 [Kazachstania naganishii CBS 8797]CCK70911.1 hypothetical protein KNAG_0F02460 [Kazachstania naganishii CBS 8797]